MTQHVRSLHAVADDLARAWSVRAPEADRLGVLPAEDVHDLRTSGYLRASIPQAYGGYECSLHACTRAQLVLAQGSTSSALVAAMPLHILGHERETRSWNEAFFKRICEYTVNGALVNSAASEPHLGSPSRGGLPETQAKSTPGGYLLNGQKTWVTGGQHLSHLLVRLRLEDRSATALVENHAQGVRWKATWRDALSLRASDSHDVFFEDVFIPEENLLQHDNAPQAPNAWFPALTAATYLGAAFAARTTLIRYAHARVPSALGEPIATLPKIQRHLGDIDVTLRAAEALLLQATQQWDEETLELPARYASIVAAKHVATEAALKATEQALQTAGGSSLNKELGLERFFRDVRAAAMHPPAGDAALELVGRQALGLSRKP